MARRYIPPSLRNKPPGGQGGRPGGDDPTTPPRRLEDLKIADAPLPGQFQAYEIHAHYCGRDFAIASRSTLNDSTAKPRQLVYVMLFRNANPRWKRDHIIFAHTDIDHLPGYKEAYQAKSEDGPLAQKEDPSGTDLIDLRSDDERTAPLAKGGIDVEKTVQAGGESSQEDSPDRPKDKPSSPPPPAEEGASSPDSAKSVPIAVFGQVDGRLDSATATFHFEGWYRLSRVDFLHPQSLELVRMLQQKFTRVGRGGRPRDITRDEAAWERSLSMRWAVVKFDKMAEPAPAPESERFEMAAPAPQSPEHTSEARAPGATPAAGRNVADVNTAEEAGVHKDAEKEES